MKKLTVFTTALLFSVVCFCQSYTLTEVEVDSLPPFPMIYLAIYQNHDGEFISDGITPQQKLYDLLEALDFIKDEIYRLREKYPELPELKKI